MPFRRRFVCIVMVACAFFMTVDAAAQSYFSVSTHKTFAPGEKIHVTCHTRSVEALEFRLYRVNDPLRFFAQLDDVHRFGGWAGIRTRERIDELTLLELFHDWKMTTWRKLRNFFRHQFRPESRAYFRERQAETAKKAPGTAAQFAQIPLLNPSQLVARWRQQVPSTYFSDRQQLPIDPQPTGVYLLEATDGTLKAYTVVIVSQTALISKVGERQLVGFLVDRSSGAPVAGAQVSFWTGKQEPQTGQTDAAGLVEFRSTVESVQDQLRVIAVRGADVAVIAPYGYMFAPSAESTTRGFVYTDRPVYRPGHTVHIKAILRSKQGDALLLPAARELTLRIHSADDKQVMNQPLTVSRTGTLSADFEVPANAALGYYRIEIAGSGAYGSFYVEEYKKPEYQVKVTTDRPRVLQGEKIRATFEARYFFGEPVANAKVSYVVHTSRYYNWKYDYEDEESEGDAGYGEEAGGDDYMYGAQQEQEQQGTLDADGKLTVEIPTRVNDKQKYDLNYRIEARVTDAANREINGRGMVLATYGAFQLFVRPESYLYITGSVPRLVVQARDYDDKPVQTAVRVTLTRPRWWFRGREVEEHFGTKDVQTDAAGNAIVEWPLSSSGSFRVTATAPSAGRQVEASTYIWIAGRDYAWGGAERRVRIVTDKRSYAVGDVAKVMVLTGVENANALITLETNTIQRKQVVAAKGGIATIDIPIAASMQPNVIINAVFISEDTLYQGTKDLKVPADDRRLKIEIVPAKSQFTPGEKATYDVVTRDAAGRPVAAELSVGVVDEAIYSIRPDQAGDILGTFYQRHYPLYNTTTSLNFFFEGEAGKKSPLLAKARTSGSRLAQIKPGAAELVQPRVRKAFPDTAYWNAIIRTDATGRARVSLDFPDSLTTWRATVRAVTADTKVGSDINRVIVRKNVIVRLAAPRFFRQGDEMTVSTIVHNYLETEKNARVSLDVKGLEVISGTTQEVSIPRRGEAKVDWRLKANDIGKATLLAKALTNEESDAMEVELPVNAFGVRRAISNSGSTVAASNTERVDIRFPESDPRSHSVEVAVSPSIAGPIFSALDYLLQYPYGCTEQTMSSFLPNVVVARTLKELKIKSDVNETELARKIAVGLERLYDFQHDDGGWGWWKEDESHTFMTAYVVIGLSQARDAGRLHNNAHIDRGRAWLRQQLRAHPSMIADLQAYVTYALMLGGDRDRALLDALWEKRGKLTPHGLAHAGLAMHLFGDARAEEAAKTLEGQARQSEGEAHWPAANDYLLDLHDTDNSVEATAAAMQLIALRHPESTLLPKTALWLVNHRDQGEWWYSTKQTAHVLFGLTEYLKVSRELEPDFTVDVLVNGKAVVSRRFTAADVSTKAPELRIPAGQLQPVANVVELRKRGKGRLYWSTRGNYYSTDRSDYQSAALKLSIIRDYFKLRQEREGNKLVYALDPLTGPVAPGDVIAVHVLVTGDRWRYLLIEDPIPAGTEFIERDDLYELKTRPSWWHRWSTRREFHDDRAAFFHTYFEGKHEDFYLLKVVNPGLFQVSPALVQPMYQPSVLATTDPQKVEVK